MNKGRVHIVEALGHRPPCPCLGSAKLTSPFKEDPGLQLLPHTSDSGLAPQQLAAPASPASPHLFSKWSHCGKAAKLLLFPADAFAKAFHHGLLGDTHSHLSGFDRVWIHRTFQEALVITCILQDIFIVWVEEEVGLGTLQGFYVVTDWEATQQLSGEVQRGGHSPAGSAGGLC